MQASHARYLLVPRASFERPAAAGGGCRATAQLGRQLGRLWRADKRVHPDISSPRQLISGTGASRLLGAKRLDARSGGPRQRQHQRGSEARSVAAAGHGAGEGWRAGAAGATRQPRAEAAAWLRGQGAPGAPGLHTLPHWVSREAVVDQCTLVAAPGYSACRLS